MRSSGKAEALYQFSSAYRGLLAVDYSAINRDRPTATTLIPSSSMAALREHTNEVGVRAELRRSMSESLKGAISVGHSERDGYRWYALGAGSGYSFMSYAASNNLSGTFPMTMVDRNRDSVRLMADWTPTEALSIQASVEQGKDHFKGPTSAGLNDTEALSFNLDASYKLADEADDATGFTRRSQERTNKQEPVIRHDHRCCHNQPTAGRNLSLHGHETVWKVRPRQGFRCSGRTGPSARRVQPMGVGQWQCAFHVHRRFFSHDTTRSKRHPHRCALCLQI